MANTQILVVEDEILVAENIQDKLKSLGYAVPAVVPSGEEAVQKAAEARPDLVLMDIKLEGEMGGVEAAEQIRARFDIPVVYLTAYADDDTLQRARITEPFGYLLKPFEARELHAAIEMALYRHKIEKTLRESEERYRSLTDDVLDGSVVGIFILDSDFRIVWANQVLERYFGLRREEIIGKDKRRLIHERIKGLFENPETFAGKVLATYDNNTYIESFECHVLPDDEREERWLEHWSQPIRSGLYVGGRIEHYTDITERKRAAEEREGLIVELQDALDKVKTLSGMLPICASCKKIRDDEGYWHQVEVYIHDHSEVEFSHGLCPDCCKKLYPQFFKDDE